MSPTQPPSELSSSTNLRSILARLASGEISVDDVSGQLAPLLNGLAGGVAVSESGDVRIDVDRARRCGFPEVVYAPGKTPDAIVTAFHKLLGAGHGCLATRCTPEQAGALLNEFSAAQYNPTARTVRLTSDEPIVGRVVVVTAGTSDRPVAEEAAETVKWMHVETELLMDVGVAGPQRLLQEKHRLLGADAVVVVAGMEGALPSVVAGWLSCPVIAVPTSVGYGAAFGGISALLGMLNSCAANVAVVNIDAGFKGGFLAGMIARQAHVAEPRRPAGG